MSRRAFWIRFVVGMVVSVIAGVIILRIGDEKAPLALPSQLGNFALAWGQAFTWWCFTGAVIAAISTLAMFRSGGSEMAGGLQIAFAASVVLVIVLTIWKFVPYPGELSPFSLIVAFLSALFVFGISAFLPETLTVFLLSILLAWIASPNRSAIDIMPDELRERYLADLARRRSNPLYRLSHPFERQPGQS
jgi:hypothetical protein